MTNSGVESWMLIGTISVNGGRRRPTLRGLTN
jgi:hypothetical protein